MVFLNSWDHAEFRNNSFVILNIFYKICQKVEKTAILTNFWLFRVRHCKNSPAQLIKTLYARHKSVFRRFLAFVCTIARSFLSILKENSKFVKIRNLVDWWGLSKHQVHPVYRMPQVMQRWYVLQCCQRKENLISIHMQSE